MLALWGCQNEDYVEWNAKVGKKKVFFWARKICLNKLCVDTSIVGSLNLNYWVPLARRCIRNKNTTQKKWSFYSFITTILSQISLRNIICLPKHVSSLCMITTIYIFFSFRTYLITLPQWSIDSVLFFLSFFEFFFSLWNHNYICVICFESNEKRNKNVFHNFNCVCANTSTAQKMNKYEENEKITVYNERKKNSNKISNLDIREELRMKIKLIKEIFLFFSFCLNITRTHTHSLTRIYWYCVIEF